MVMCRECKGSGVVEFTKERGGPVCNNCGGVGEITPKIMRRVIASILDSPSVYMGGPSHQNLRKADRIIEYLAIEGFLSLGDAVQESESVPHDPQADD